ncbi:MAG: D-aminoacyl-tRNA deacylase [Gammaproteobacteria bacterium]|nr:D-aminoacyl-tRNA deacylase [Gammaproteobacteria bacterium]
MIGLLQRVSRASVTVNNQIVGKIEVGLLVLVAIQRNDATAQAKRLLERLLTYRVFEDEAGRMNLDVTQVNGGLLFVPQFTLAANTRKGNRPSFSEAAEPGFSETLYAELVNAARSKWHKVASGVFGANMDVSLVNKGPVTFWLEVPPHK